MRLILTSRRRGCRGWAAERRRRTGGGGEGWLPWMELARGGGGALEWGRGFVLGLEWLLLGVGC